MIVYIVHTYFVADGKLSLLEFFYFLRIVLNLCGSTGYVIVFDYKLYQKHGIHVFLKVEYFDETAEILTRI